MLLWTLILLAVEDRVNLQNLDLFRQLSPSQVTQAPDGTIYILDSEESKVLTFSSEGQPLTPFGQSGQGPGEFQWPSRIDFFDGHIVVYTFQALHFFKPDGAFVSKTSSAGAMLPVRGGFLAADFPAAFVETPARLQFWKGGQELEKKTILEFDRIPLNRFPAPNKDGGLNIVPALDYIHLIGAGDARHGYFYAPGQRDIHVIDGLEGKLLHRLELPEPLVFNQAWGEAEYANMKTAIQERSRSAGRPVAGFTVFYPENFPALRAMRVLDGLLHVTLWSASPDRDKPVIAFALNGTRTPPRFDAGELAAIATIHEGHAWVITWDSEEEQAGLIRLPRAQATAYIAAHPLPKMY